MEHVRLPKLTDYGLVEWTRRSDEVVRGRNSDEVRPLPESLVDNEDELPADRL